MEVPVVAQELLHELAFEAVVPRHDKEEIGEPLDRLVLGEFPCGYEEEFLPDFLHPLLLDPVQEHQGVGVVEGFAEVDDFPPEHVFHLLHDNGVHKQIFRFAVDEESQDVLGH